MKVMFINSVVDYGSTGKIVRSLMDGLISTGNEAIAVYGRQETMNKENTFSLYNKPSMYFHFFMSKYFNRHGMHSTRQTKKLIKFIDAYEPDIIHLHNLHGYYLNAPMLLDYLSGFSGKIIWTLHDAWLISGSSAYFDYNGCKVWDKGCVECNSTRDYPESLGFQRQAKNFDWKVEKILNLHNLVFVTPSVWLKDLIGTSYLEKFPCLVVNNGIDTNVFKETHDASIEKQFEGKKVLLGVASVWERRKGLDDFIALSSILPQEYQVVLIGLTNDQIGSLPQNIIGVERTENAKQLAAYYSLAYAFINPTYEDNYPTTNLESVACATPVIAYDTGGNKEVAGVITVPQGDLNAVVTTLGIVNDMVIPETDFSNEKFVSQMLEIYDGENNESITKTRI